MLEGYGYVVKPKNYQEFADKVMYILKNPDIASDMGADARQRVLNGFTIEDMVDNYAKTYKQMYEDVLQIRQTNAKG